MSRVRPLILLAFCKWCEVDSCLTAAFSGACIRQDFLCQCALEFHDWHWCQPLTRIWSRRIPIPRWWICEGISVYRDTRRIHPVYSFGSPEKLCPRLTKRIKNCLIMIKFNIYSITINKKSHFFKFYLIFSFVKLVLNLQLTFHCHCRSKWRTLSSFCPMEKHREKFR